MATTIGLVGLSAVTYLLVADVRACRGRGDFACVLNTNQGVLTLLALFLGAVAIWVTIILRVADSDARGSEHQDRARAALREAVEETVHNLGHVARACDEDGPAYFPTISLRAISVLAGVEFRSEFSPLLRTEMDTSIRNGERLQNDAALVAPILLRVAISDSDADRDDSADDTEETTPAKGRRRPTVRDYLGAINPNVVESFAGKQVGFLILAAGSKPDWTERLYEARGLQDLKPLIDRWRELHATAQRKGLPDPTDVVDLFMSASYYYAHRTSEVPEHALARLRHNDAYLVCWFDDARHDGIRTVALGQHFHDGVSVL